MTSTAEKVSREILLDGLVDCVDLPRIHWLVEQELPNADATELQAVTISVIRTLVEDGLVETGYPDNGEFVSESLDDSLEELQRSYIAQYHEPIAWFGRLWLNLTDKGVAAATATPEGRRVAEHEKKRSESSPRTPDNR